MMRPSPYRVLSGLRGLGALTDAQMAFQSAAAALAAAAPLSGPAAPFLAAGAALLSLLGALGIGSGCGQTCVAATNVVNQAEPLLLANLQAYENGQITQAAAQAVYTQVWNFVQQSCQSIPAPGGTQCISDRQQGACTWKQTSTSVLLPYVGEGEPATGQCWNWYVGYYVPLTYPPLNAPSASVVSDGAASSTAASSSNPLSGLVAWISESSSIGTFSLPNWGWGLLGFGLAYALTEGE